MALDEHYVRIGVSEVNDKQAKNETYKDCSQVCINCCIIIIISAFINAGYFLGLVFGNTLWLIAIMYYIYNTFLGYSGKQDLNVFNNKI